MDHHDYNEQPGTRDYVIFVLILLGILAAALLLAMQAGFTVPLFLRLFMGVFFVVFAAFKLADIKGFVESYIGYDLIAAKWKGYAYAYPFIELALGLGYLAGIKYLDLPTIILMAIGSAGVARQLLRKSNIRCACLGSFVKLPLTTVSLVEDVGMGIMALILLSLNF